MRRSYIIVALSIAMFACIAGFGLTRSLGAGTATEGCMNQWLFNGVWRVKATKVEPLMDGGQQMGWQVTEVWHNGTSGEIAPSDSFLKDQQLELGNGSSIDATASTTGTLSHENLWSHSFQAAGQFTHVQIFRAAAPVDPANKPKAVDVIFDDAKLANVPAKPQFTTRQYDFHLKLDCTSSAGAQAQGGSMEMAAKAGCMNQWMSNGVWRVRTTAVGPDNGDSGGPQIGWMVSEEWTSLAKRPVAPGDTAITDQQLVLANGDTIASSNSAGTSMNANQLVFHTFNPGGSFSYQQRFREANLDANNKPVRLLVTFDGKLEKQRPNQPQYTTNPPNFRISFDCTK